MENTLADSKERAVVLEAVWGLAALDLAALVQACFVGQMVSLCIVQTDPFARLGSASSS